MMKEEIREMPTNDATAANDIENAAVLLSAASERARVPISAYRVGALAVGKSGRAYAGANVEFPSLPLNFTVHAEQAAVINARLHGEESVELLIVTAPPCGHCRQFLTELGNPSLRAVFGGVSHSLSELLPRSFSLPTGGEKLMSRAKDMEEALKLAAPEDVARAMAKASYSPYTGTKSGAALLTASGKLFGGCLLECGAYNPSLTAIQTALTAHALGRGDEIAKICLAETGATPLAPVLGAIVRSVAPRAEIEIIKSE